MSTQSTMPPPETPRMSARHDSTAPRAIAYAGPESRYHRLRRESALEAQLSASLELGAAIEAIRIVDCHALPHGTCDVTGEPLPTHCCTGAHEDDHPPCVQVYALDIGATVYARTLEDAACELLLTHDARQDQSPEAVARVVAMIEASFARAAQKGRE